MHTTSASLLERLRQPDDQGSWDRFAQLYTPLLLRWARRLGLQDQDAADLVQEIFITLVHRMPGFRYEPTLRFRGWLWTVTLNAWKMFQRRAARQRTTEAKAAEPEADADGASAFEEDEYRRHLVGRAMQLMQAEFQPTTWRACWECTISGRPAAEVAASLGISVGAVYVAKSRVLHRLREELGQLLD